MKAETASQILSREIIFLERKKSQEFNSLKEQLHNTYESIKPINILKSTFEDITNSPEIKHDFAKAAIAMFTGYLVKKLVFKSSVNPLKILAGAAFQTYATNIAAKNSDKIKDAGVAIFEMVKGLIKSNKRELSNQ